MLREGARGSIKSIHLFSVFGEKNPPICDAAYPAGLSWPDQTLYAVSLSHTLPNLMLFSLRHRELASLTKGCIRN